jgi:membrane protein implicated in regulation of membrane protease activity
MTSNDYRSYAVAAFGAVAVAVWAGLPLVLVPFAAASVFFVVYITRVVRRDTESLTEASNTRVLDGSHERIDQPDQ